MNWPAVILYLLGAVLCSLLIAERFRDRGEPNPYPISLCTFMCVVWPLVVAWALVMIGAVVFEARRPRL